MRTLEVMSQNALHTARFQSLMDLLRMLAFTCHAYGMVVATVTTPKKDYVAGHWTLQTTQPTMSSPAGSTNGH